MNEKLKEFLNQKRDAENKKYEEEKRSTLLELGLYEKEYSPDNTYSEEFSSFEWDNDNSKNKYYKKVPIEITDDEYNEVKKYSKKEGTTERDPVAIALMVIAWIVFGAGFIAGIAFGNVSFILTLTYWIGSLISGMLFLGFAKVIDLLNDIKNK